jgi:hypothetical protein
MHVTLYILCLLTQLQTPKLVKWQSVESMQNGIWKPFQRIEYHYRPNGVIDSISIFEEGQLIESRRYFVASRPMSLSDITSRRVDPDICSVLRFSRDSRQSPQYLSHSTFQTPGFYLSKHYTTATSGHVYLLEVDTVIYDKNGWIQFASSADYDSNGAIKLRSIDSIAFDTLSGVMEHHQRAIGDRGFSDRIQYRYEFRKNAAGNEEIHAYSARSRDSLVPVAKFTDIIWSENAKDNQDRSTSRLSFKLGSAFLSGHKVFSRATQWLYHPLTGTWINALSIRTDFNSQGLPLLIDREGEYTELTYFVDGSMRSEFGTLKEPGDWMYLNHTREIQPDGTMIETQFESKDEDPSPKPRFRMVNHY